MNRLAALCAATAFALTLAACNQTPATPPNTHDADVKAIQDNETQWNADWAARDAAKASAHYTDDAVLMVSGGPPTSGRDAIQKMSTAMLADPTTSLKFQSSKVDVASSGDLGYSQGTYTLTVTDSDDEEADFRPRQLRYRLP